MWQHANLKILPQIQPFYFHINAFWNIVFIVASKPMFTVSCASRQQHKDSRNIQAAGELHPRQYFRINHLRIMVDRRIKTPHVVSGYLNRTKGCMHPLFPFIEITWQQESPVFPLISSYAWVLSIEERNSINLTVNKSEVMNNIRKTAVKRDPRENWKAYYWATQASLVDFF